MLAAEFLVEPVLEDAESNILMAGDGNGCRLVFGCMHLDVVFQRVVVDVMEAPLWCGFSLKQFSVFHYSPRTNWFCWVPLIAVGKAWWGAYRR